MEAINYRNYVLAMISNLSVNFFVTLQLHDIPCQSACFSVLHLCKNPENSMLPYPDANNAMTPYGYPIIGCPLTDDLIPNPPIWPSPPYPRGNGPMANNVRHYRGIQDEFQMRQQYMLSPQQQQEQQSNRYIPPPLFRQHPSKWYAGMYRSAAGRSPQIPNWHTRRRRSPNYQTNMPVHMQKQRPTLPDRSPLSNTALYHSNSYPHADLTAELLDAKCLFLPSGGCADWANILRSTQQAYTYSARQSSRGGSTVRGWQYHVCVCCIFCSCFLPPQQ